MDRIEEAEERALQNRLQSFRCILEDPKQSMLVTEIVRASHLASRIELGVDFSPKIELKKRILKLTSATGADGTQEAWNEIAALALRMSDSVKPRLQRDTGMAPHKKSTLVPINADLIVH